MSSFSQDFLDRDRDLIRNIAFVFVFVFVFEGLFASSGTLNPNDWIVKMES